MLRISFDFVPYGTSTSTSTYHIIIYNKNKNEKCSMFTKFVKNCNRLSVFNSLYLYCKCVGMTRTKESSLA